MYSATQQHSFAIKRWKGKLLVRLAGIIRPSVRPSTSPYRARSYNAPHTSFIWASILDEPREHDETQRLVKQRIVKSRNPRQHAHDIFSPSLIA